MEQPLKGADLKEGIGLASGTAAVPTIWAKDAFRCCPYPASAFWDAPFVKWHEDIHGHSTRDCEKAEGQLIRDRVVFSTLSLSDAQPPSQAHAENQQPPHQP